MDIVVVSVKVPDHRAAIEPVLKAKKDVFVEWPLARDLKEAEYLTSLAKQNNLKTLIGLQARHSPSIRKAKEIVESGKLGDILGTTMNAHGSLFGPTLPADYKYMLPIEAGANLLTIPFGHAADALCYVLGEFQDLQATLANHRPRLPVVVDGKVVEEVDKAAHDHIAVIGRLARGGGVASIVYQGGMSSTDKNFYWEITGTKGSLVFEGPHGHVQMFQPKLKFVAAEQGAKLEEVDVKMIENDFSYNVGSAWDSLAGVGDGSVTTFEDALLRHKMIDAIYRSNEKGTRESYL